MTFASIEIPASGLVIVPCLAGQRIRIVSIRQVITGPAAGNMLTVTMGQGTAIKAGTCSGLVAEQIENFYGFIGGTVTPGQLDKIDPVTGTATYLSEGSDATFSLPDVSWDYPVTVQVSCINATLLTGTVLYEIVTKMRSGKVRQ
jgi:hypothetical protein